MEVQAVKRAVSTIYEKMTEQKDYLVQLDQQSGDGGLGFSACGGFGVLCEAPGVTKETDFGEVFLMTSETFDEAAPSSLGTILSLGIVGMVKRLKGGTEVSQEGMAKAMQAGVDSITEKAGSKVGEKTTLDTLVLVVEELRRYGGEMVTGDVWAVAAAVVGQDSGSTRQMKLVRGRAAYYAEEGIGILDGGFVVGKPIFEGAAESIRQMGGRKTDEQAGRQTGKKVSGFTREVFAYVGS